MNDTQPTKGQVRIESYRLSKINTFLVKAMRFLGIDHVNFVRSHAIKMNFDTGFVSNMIMNVGRTLQAQRLGGIGGTAAATYINCGSSSTAPVASQTALGTELTTGGFTRTNVTPTTVTTNVANDTLQLQTTFTITATADVEEMGIFNAASVGTMVGRALTGSKGVTAGDTLVATYQIIYG